MVISRKIMKQSDLVTSGTGLNYSCTGSSKVTGGDDIDCGIHGIAGTNGGGATGDG